MIRVGSTPERPKVVRRSAGVPGSGRLARPGPLLERLVPDDPAGGEGSRLQG